MSLADLSNEPKFVVLVKSPSGDVLSVLGPKHSEFEAKITTQILRLPGGHTAEVRPLREVDAYDCHGDPPHPADAAFATAHDVPSA